MPQHGTLLGPLTTAWSQPASCSVFYRANEDSPNSLSGQRCVNVDRDGRGHAEDDPDCWPPRMKGVKDHNIPLNGWGFYSPGLECPIGYTSACTAISGGEQWQVQFEPRPRETAVGCCPKGFTCSAVPVVDGEDLAFPQTCVSISDSVDLLYNARCTGTAHTGVSSVVVTEGDTDTSTILTLFFHPSAGPKVSRLYPHNTDTSTSRMLDTDNGNTVTVIVTEKPKPTISEPTVTLYAPLFQLKFQSTDITTATVATTPSISSSSAPDSTSKGNAALSTGTKIGIGVGVGIGGVLFAALLGLFVRWRKKLKRTLAAEHGSSPSGFKEKPTPTRVNNPMLSELSGETHPTELPVN